MSSTTEERDKEAKAPDVVFKGIDGNECEAFVVAIQDFAFAKGLDEDHHWMLRFARIRLRGKALRWYATLDPSIQKDWYLFVKALFDQYPLADEPGVAEAEVATPVWSTTTFSPAPSTVALPSNPVADRNATGLKTSVLPTRQYDPSSTGQQLGLLRIVTEEEGTSVPQYVWWGYAVEEIVMRIEYQNGSSAHPKGTTFNRHEALLVSFLPSSNPHSIGCVNSRVGLKTLVIQCNYSDASGVGNCTLYGCTNNYHTYTTPIAGKLRYVSKTWNLLADGTLQASLSSFSRKSQYDAFEESKFSTTEVHVNTSGDIIRFVKPGTSLEQGKNEGTFIHPFVRARIVFEPL